MNSNYIEIIEFKSKSKNKFNLLLAFINHENFNQYKISIIGVSIKAIRIITFTFGVYFAIELEDYSLSLLVRLR